MVQSQVYNTESNKSKALVVSKSRTVCPPHGDFVLSGVSTRASSNLGILGVKFDSVLSFEDHVHGIIFCVSQRIGILRLVNGIFVDTNQFSITSGQGWLGPMLCTVKLVKKVSCGGVFDLAVEQPQLFRKLHKNKTNTSM